MGAGGLGMSIEALYRGMVRATSQSHAYGSVPGESFADWQRRLRGRLLELLAIEGQPRPAPAVRFVQEEWLDGYVRRRGYMVAADGLAVPLYVLEPEGRRERMGLCLAPHGHGPGKIIPVGIAPDEKARRLIEEGERDYAVQAVRRGYLTIAWDQRGFGELVLPQDLRDGRGGCEQLALRSFHLGRPLLGQKVADAMQLVDWALARGDVDASRVVITGTSGGGTMTLFTAAVDTRVSAAAPSCYVSTFADSILDMHHCACNYVPGLQAVAEMADLGGLVAPRPMLVIAGVQDPIFPIDAVRRAVERLWEIYGAAGAAGNMDLYEGAGGHRYYACRPWDFFEEHLG